MNREMTRILSKDFNLLLTKSETRYNNGFQHHPNTLDSHLEVIIRIIGTNINVNDSVHQDWVILGDVHAGSAAIDEEKFFRCNVSQISGHG